MFDDFRRSRRATTLGAVAALTLALAPATAASAAVTRAPADSVTLERSGGFAGITQRFTVNRDSADRQAVTVLNLTAGQRFRALRAQYLPADLCCDRFRYDIVVRYRDGEVKTVTAVDGAPATPAVLTDVIQLVTQVGTPVTP